MNPSLAISPCEPELLAEKTLDVVLGRSEVLRAAALQQACSSYLSARNSIDVFLPSLVP